MLAVLTSSIMSLLEAKLRIGETPSWLTGNMSISLQILPGTLSRRMWTPLAALSLTNFFFGRNKCGWPLFDMYMLLQNVESLAELKMQLCSFCVIVHARHASSSDSSCCTSLANAPVRTLFQRNNDKTKYRNCWWHSLG